MFENSAAFSGFAVDDIDAARTFYADTLGLTVELNEMGILDIALGSGAHVIAYPKPDHEPAGFTILNFPVDDVDAAVDELNAKGVVTKIYDGEYGGDEKGICTGVRPRHRVVPRPGGQRAVGAQGQLTPHRPSPNERATPRASAGWRIARGVGRVGSGGDQRIGERPAHARRGLALLQRLGQIGRRRRSGRARSR